jgi:hypothetical protein
MSSKNGDRDRFGFRIVSSTSFRDDPSVTQAAVPSFQVETALLEACET